GDWVGGIRIEPADASPGCHGCVRWGHVFGGGAVVAALVRESCMDAAADICGGRGPDLRGVSADRPHLPVLSLRFVPEHLCDGVWGATANAQSLVAVQLSFRDTISRRFSGGVVCA